MLRTRSSSCCENLPMEFEERRKYLGSAKLNIIEAMQKIDQNNRGILYIVGEGAKLLGSLTDGDIRRWIIRTGKLDGCVEQVMFAKTKYLTENERERAGEFMLAENLSSVPILDADRRITDILFLDESGRADERESGTALFGIPVVIMAGGKGTRLYPFTKILPKPLIPIGDIPIIERIIERFCAYGADLFYLTVNYKKEMIKSYFSELAPAYGLCYVEEELPLGTAGSLRLIEEEFKVPVIISNCDTLIEADYEKVLTYHKESHNALTIVAALKNTTIPYGVIHSKEQGLVASMEEKPCMSYFINTGMYVICPEYIKRIPKGRVYHMTDLAEALIADGCKVGMYPISENSFWDMGEFKEMKKMEDRINHGFVRG